MLGALIRSRSKATLIESIYAYSLGGKRVAFRNQLDLFIEAVSIFISKILFGFLAYLSCSRFTLS